MSEVQRKEHRTKLSRLARERIAQWAPEKRAEINSRISQAKLRKPKQERIALAKKASTIAWANTTHQQRQARLEKARQAMLSHSPEERKNWVRKGGKMAQAIKASWSEEERQAFRKKASLGIRLWFSSLSPEERLRIIIIRSCNGHRRAKKLPHSLKPLRKRTGFECDLLVPADFTTPVNIAAARELKRIIGDKINLLSSTQRLILEGLIVEDKGMHEVVNETGLTELDVDKELTDSLKILRTDPELRRLFETM